MEKSPRKEKILEYFNKLKPEIDKTIEKYLAKKASKKWLEFIFEKPSYKYNLKAAQKALLDPAWNFLEGGGKRWRPILFLLLTEALGGDIENVKDFAIIPELAHEGSIIVDDIEDNSELRRGKPCLHKIFGTDLALNVGNFLYFLPILVLIKNRDKFEPKILLSVYENYIQEITNIHFGQGIDIYWHKGGAKKINQEEYLQMCAFKTGCLVRMAAKMAAILAGKDKEFVKKIGKLAESIGIAFQIQDDILDITLRGEARKKFGKSFGNDIKEGKRTLMVIYTLKQASRKDKKRLIQILNKHTEDTKEKKEAISIIQKYGAVKYAKNLAKNTIENSWKEVNKLLPPSPAKNKLKEFFNYLIKRKI